MESQRNEQQRQVLMGFFKTSKGEYGEIDTSKIGMIFYESFNNQYYSLGDKESDAWREGRKLMTKTPIDI